MYHVPVGIMGIVKRTVSFIVMGILFISQLCAAVYVIDRYEIEITGRTRESVVRRLIGNDEGTTFDDLQTLENAVERKRQALLDLRILKSVDAQIVCGAEENGEIPVTVRIIIDGAISFIVFPSVYYDSNYGFFYQIFVQDQNFLGTTGKLNFSFTVRENDNRHELKHSDIISYVSTELPLGRDWNLFLMVALQHRALDREETRLSFENTIEKKLFETGFVSHRIIVFTNPESQLRHGPDMITALADYLKFAPNEYFTFTLQHLMNNTFTDHLVMVDEASLSASLNLDKFTGAKITPSAGFYFFGGNERPKSTALEFALKASDSLISWYGDLRRGYSYEIESYFRTNGFWKISGEAKVLAMPLDWLQLSARTVFRFSDFPEVELTNLFTGYMRGIPNINPVIKDKEIDNIAVLNLDVLAHIFSIPKFVRAYVNPFVDLGWVGPDRFLASAGAEIMFILNEWPGAPGRISYGVNLLDPREDELSLTVYFFY